MFLAHAPISFLANELIQRKKILKLKQNEKILIGIFALLCGLLPDVDMLVLLATTTPTFMHHTLITHAPLFYIALWLVLKLLFWIFNKWFNKSTQKVLNPEFVNVLLNTFLIATLFHLLADIFAENIMLFYPFSTQSFSMFKTILEPNLFAGYFFSITFGIELVFCGIFLIYIFKKIFKDGILLKIFNALLILCSSVFLAFTIYIHFNTYNKSNLYDSSGKQNYDIDYDTLSDDMDWDVDNDGHDNIIDIQLPELVSQVETIISSGKWTANSKATSLVEKMKYEVGGFTSYRLISQAYWNIHSPIDPVLKDMLTKNGSLKGYSWDYNPLDAFYEYFNTNNLLSALDLDTDKTLPQGAIFFVLDAYGNVLNTGIVLESNNVGTVLPYDQNLKTHTYQELKNYYGNEVTIMITE